MANYVWDNLPTPPSKVDAGPLPGPANQNVTSAEFNEVTGALQDIRAVIQSIAGKGSVTGQLFLIVTDKNGAKKYIIRDPNTNDLTWTDTLPT